MVEIQELKQKTDWLVPTAVVLGGAGIAAGLYFYMKKPSFSAGDKIYCVFKYKHAGPGGAYRARVVMGHTVGSPPFGYFDEMDETMQEYDIEVPPSVELKDVKNLVIYEVPKVLNPDKYDLEASLRYSDGKIIERVIANDIIQVK